MRFVLATANPDKAAEIAAIFTDFELLPRPPDVPDVEEDGDTLAANAVKKAIALVDATGEAAVADDTGLEVSALGGAPGLRTARFAGAHATYADNVEKLLRELDGVADRRARFITVAVAAFPDGHHVVAEGSVDGVIATSRRGANGFGYDPVFVPHGGDGLTFAETTDADKHELSHRGKAFRGLAYLLKHPQRSTTALFYDDQCKFCRASAARVARSAKSDRFDVLPFSDAAADHRLASLSADERAASMHVVRPDGTVLSGGAAFTELLAGTPLVAWLARWARRSARVQRVVDRMYWVIADNRSRIGRFVRDVPPVVRRRDGD